MREVHIKNDGPPPLNSRLIGQLTVDQLTDIVRAVVRQELAQQERSSKRAL